MIKAVIYDVDGVLVDSEPLHVDAWNRALQFHEYSIKDLSEEFKATMAGRKPIVIATRMIEELDLAVTPEALLNEKATIFMNAIKTDLKGMPGVVDSVKRLYDKGYKLGIGTSLTRDYIQIVLRNLSLAEYFDVIVTGDEIKNGKPHPDTYLTVAKKLGVNPEECVVLEDATSGIRSAKAAGCYCIAITNPYALTQDVSQADRVIASLDEVTYTLIKTLDRLH